MRISFFETGVKMDLNPITGHPLNATGGIDAWRDNASKYNIALMLKGRRRDRQRNMYLMRRNAMRLRERARQVPALEGKEQTFQGWEQAYLIECKEPNTNNWYEADEVQKLVFWCSAHGQLSGYARAYTNVRFRVTNRTTGDAWVFPGTNPSGSDSSTGANSRQDIAGPIRGLFKSVFNI